MSWLRHSQQASPPALKTESKFLLASTQSIQLKPLITTRPLQAQPFTGLCPSSQVHQCLHTKHFLQMETGSLPSSLLKQVSACVLMHCRMGKSLRERIPLAEGMLKFRMSSTRTGRGRWGRGLSGRACLASSKPGFHPQQRTTGCPGVHPGIPAPRI